MSPRIPGMASLPRDCLMKQWKHTRLFWMVFAVVVVTDLFIFWKAQ